MCHVSSISTLEVCEECRTRWDNWREFLTTFDRVIPGKLDRIANPGLFGWIVGALSSDDPDELAARDAELVPFLEAAERAGLAECERDGTWVVLGRLPNHREH